MINPSLLIIVAIILMVLELFVPSFGILGVIGFLSFVVGFFSLLEPLDPIERQNLLFLVIPSVVVFLGLAAVIASVLFKGRKRLFAKPEIAPVGEIGEAAEDFGDREGMIRIEGELWSAELVEPGRANRGDKLLVLARKGLTLTVQHVHKV